jgi:hypothetical protein
MLAIQRYIREHGLEKTVSDFNLIYKDYGHKFLLKYDQIESPMLHEEVRDCRGLVLDKNYNVLSLGFRKFFNYGEGHAAKIDWPNCKIYKKLDGSFIQVYWDPILNRWETGTTGTADGITPVNNKPDTTFRSLFWESFDKSSSVKQSGFEQQANKDYVYMFELCTPWNIVVAPHSTAHVGLLSIRDRSTMFELHDSIVSMIADSFGLMMPEFYELERDPEKLKETLLSLPYKEEGYVVVDPNFNRVKIKNPAYLTVHHMKDETANWRIIDVVKSNEIDEFAATFIDRTEELLSLKEKYDKVVDLLEKFWAELSTIEVRKDFALAVLKICQENSLRAVQAYFFTRKDGKVDSAKQFMIGFDGKDLYNFLIKMK